MTENTFRYFNGIFGALFDLDLDQSGNKLKDWNQNG